MGAAIKHGASRGRKLTKTYCAWVSMRKRCRDKSNLRYGGRGISVCPEWEDYRTFLRDMGEAPKGMSIDRINNDGNYEPSNCRWATAYQQIHNRSPVRFQDLSGRQYGRWLVVMRSGESQSGNTYWLCRCECGAEKVVGSGQLKNGQSKSCGCLRREISAVTMRAMNRSLRIRET